MKSSKYEGIRRRALAYLIDNLLLVPVFALIHYSFFGTWIRHVPDFKLSFATHPVCLSFVLIYFTYFVVFESAFEATPGKLLLGIRVIKGNGQRCGFKQAFIRNIMRLIDGFALYLVGIILISKSNKRQRLGDRLAGTVVLREVDQC